MGAFGQNLTVDKEEATDHQPPEIETLPGNSDFSMSEEIIDVLEEPVISQEKLNELIKQEATTSNPPIELPSPQISPPSNHETKDKLFKIDMTGKTVESIDQKFEAALARQEKKSDTKIPEFKNSMAKNLTKLDKRYQFINGTSWNKLGYISAIAIDKPAIISQNSWHSITQTINQVTVKINDRISSFYQNQKRKVNEISTGWRSVHFFVANRRVARAAAKECYQALSMMGLNPKQLSPSQKEDFWKIIAAPITGNKYINNMIIDNLESSDFKLKLDFQQNKFVSEFLSKLSIEDRSQIVDKKIWPKLKEELQQTIQLLRLTQKVHDSHPETKAVLNFSQSTAISVSGIQQIILENPELLKSYPGGQKIYDMKEQIKEKSNYYQNSVDLVLKSIKLYLLAMDNVSENLIPATHEKLKNDQIKIDDNNHLSFLQLYQKITSNDLGGLIYPEKENKKIKNKIN